MSELFCRKCHEPREAAELVMLTGVSGRVSYLCRPNSGQGCFTNDAHPRSDERIGTVDDDHDGDAAR